MAKELRFAGLADAQVLCLFEKIATTVTLMAEMCRLHGLTAYERQ